MGQSKDCCHGGSLTWFRFNMEAAARAFSGIFEKENELSKKEEMEEYMFLGLRMTKGILKTEFSKRFGTGILDVYRKPIQELSG